MLRYLFNDDYKKNIMVSLYPLIVCKNYVLSRYSFYQCYSLIAPVVKSNLSSKIVPFEDMFDSLLSDLWTKSKLCQTLNFEFAYPSTFIHY